MSDQSPKEKYGEKLLAIASAIIVIALIITSVTGVVAVPDLIVKAVGN